MGKYQKYKLFIKRRVSEVETPFLFANFSQEAPITANAWRQPTLSKIQPINQPEMKRRTNRQTNTNITFLSYAGTPTFPSHPPGNPPAKATSEGQLRHAPTAVLRLSFVVPVQNKSNAARLPPTISKNATQHLLIIYIKFMNGAGSQPGGGNTGNLVLFYMLN